MCPARVREFAVPRILPHSNSEDARPNVFRTLFTDGVPLVERNPCHVPAGSPKGGQFAQKGAGGCPDASKIVPRDPEAHGPFYGGKAIPVKGAWYNHPDTPEAARKAYDVWVANKKMDARVIDAAEQQILKEAGEGPVRTEEERIYSRLLAVNVVESIRALARGDTFTRFKLGTPEADPKRVAEGEKIVDDILAESNRKAPEYREGSPQPQLLIMLGMTGLGKTTALKTHFGDFANRAVVADADEIKSKLKEYRGYNASEVHEESSLLNKRLIGKAISQRRDLLIDVVGRKAKSILEYVSDARKAGYRVSIVHVDGTVEDSVASSIIRLSEMTTAKRAGKPVFPRNVPLGYTKTAYEEENGVPSDAVKRTFREVRGLVDAWAVLDNRAAMAARRRAAREGHSAGHITGTITSRSAAKLF